MKRSLDEKHTQTHGSLLKPEVRLMVFWFQIALLQASHDEICIGEGHPDSHDCANNLHVMMGVAGKVLMGMDELSEGQVECCR